MSQFLNDCWALVGAEVRDPKALNELFQTFELERGKLEDSEARHTETRNELANVYNELHAANKKIQKLEDRENVHIRPMLSAFTAHLLFPDAPEAESAKSLLRRVNRARGDDSVNPAIDQAVTEEEEKMRERRRQHAKNDAERVRNANAQLSLDGELKAAQARIAELEKKLSDQALIVRQAELDRKDMIRFHKASTDLAEAFSAFKRATFTIPVSKT